MKIFAAADIHGSQYRLNIILDHIELTKPDIAVICGDITQFGPGEIAENFLNQIPVDILAIPGNIDTLDVGDAIIASSAENIDRKRIMKNDIPFIGIGGELPASLADISIKVNKQQKHLHDILNETSVLVTHVPPYKTQDRVFLGHHIGSKELRQYVDRCKPRLVLCGHVHEDPGVMHLDKTIVVNCSIGKKTGGALIDINDDIDVSLFH